MGYWPVALSVYGSNTLGSRGYFFLIDISRRSRVNETQSAEEKKITSGHRSTQSHFHARNQFRNWTGSPIGYSHVQLFDAANQGHCYIVNSLRTWEYPIGDPVQFLNWFLAWKWGCVLLWPEVIWALSSEKTITDFFFSLKSILLSEKLFLQGNLFQSILHLPKNTHFMGFFYRVYCVAVTCYCQ